MTYAGAVQVRVPKASEMVAAHLRRQIVRGELQEGDLLPAEAALLEMFGVSRPTLREAYRILENESIITVQRGAKGGAKVLVPDQAVAANQAGLLLQYRGTLLADVYDARAMIEATAVGELALIRSDADLTRLGDALAAGEAAAGDAVAFAQQDASFHRLLIELAGNSTIDLLVGMLYSIIESHNRTYLATHDHAAERGGQRAAIRSHRKLVGLLHDKDGDAARTFWRKHLKGVADYMIDDPTTTVIEILSGDK